MTERGERADWYVVDRTSVDPSEEGELRNKDGAFSLQDKDGIFLLRDFLTEAQHKALKNLIHFLSAGPGDGFGAGPYYAEILPDGNPFPTSETWYTNSDKTARVVRYEVTYNANKTIATETTIIYNNDGVNPLAQAVDTYTYTGVFQSTCSRAITVY